MNIQMLQTVLDSVGFQRGSTETIQLPFSRLSSNLNVRAYLDIIRTDEGGLYYRETVEARGIVGDAYSRQNKYKVLHKLHVFDQYEDVTALFLFDRIASIARITEMPVTKFNGTFYPLSLSDKMKLLAPGTPDMKGYGFCRCCQEPTVTKTLENEYKCLEAECLQSDDVSDY